MYTTYPIKYALGFVLLCLICLCYSSWWMACILQNWNTDTRTSTAIEITLNSMGNESSKNPHWNTTIKSKPCIYDVWYVLYGVLTHALCIGLGLYYIFSGHTCIIRQGNGIHWKLKGVIMTISSSVVEPKIVIKTTSGATRANKSGIVTAMSIQLIYVWN